ncbi:MAG: glycosyltransferase family 4 protein [Gemmatimonadota bacterium]
MNVLYVYDGAWPHGATRPRKQTMALSEAGHRVTLVSRNAERARREEEETWMSVRRMPTFPGPLNTLLNFPLFFSPVWFSHIARSARVANADVIVVEDLPLAPTALAVARVTGTPLVYDMGEVYPEFLKGLQERTPPNLVNRVLRSPEVARALERHVLRGADHTAVVSNESRDRALTRGATTERISIVGNTPEDVASLTAPTECPSAMEAMADKKVVLFVGIMIHDRGLHELVAAMPAVIERHADAALVIVGEGPERPRLTESVEQLGLSDHVVMTGWEDHARLPAYYQRARVGMLPFLPGGQIDFTLANKMFDYLGAGLPVVATDVPPMRRIVEESQAGRLVSGPTPESLADGISSLLAVDEAEWHAMSERGKAIVRDEYNWPNDAARFVAAVEAVGRRDL